MFDKIKALLGSKWFRSGISIVLIYLAFRKVDFNGLVAEIVQVPWWFTVLMVGYFCVVSVLGAYRWSLLLVKRPDWQDVWVFSRSTFIGGFYALFFPSGFAGDLFKWMYLTDKYPHLTKTKLLGSALLDRVVGFTAFIVFAFAASIVAKFIGFKFPGYIFWLFLGLFVGVIIFYVLIMVFEAEKWLDNIKFLKKLDQVIELIKGENKGQLIKALVVALVSEVAWLAPIWVMSNAIGAGMSLVSVFVFMPVIALILVLPISIAGLGAREQLFLYFFGQIGILPVKALAVASYNGIISVLVYLIGGLFLLI